MYFYSYFCICVWECSLYIFYLHCLSRFDLPYIHHVDHSSEFLFLFLDITFSAYPTNAIFVGSNFTVPLYSFFGSSSATRYDLPAIR